ncbi:MAG: AI-2E family transporter [Bacteroidetes bacterium]|nr:MAG: AI-2E family transporter [Bacteroidota bacterium]
MALSRFTNLLIALVAIVFILMVTKTYLLPFIIALLIWYFIYQARAFLRKSELVRSRFPTWAQNALVFALSFLILGLAARVLGENIQEFSKVLPTYDANIQKINTAINQYLNIDIMANARAYVGNLNLTAVVQPILQELSSTLASGFMILLYTVFILLEERRFHQKFLQIFATEDQFRNVNSLIRKIDDTFSRYIILKTFVSLLTAVLSFVVLLIIGVDAPALWAFIIFLLNYIPSIGSLIATAFPAVVAMLQNGHVGPGLWVLFGVGTIQVLVGNVLEPRLMGDSLNISPLVVIISLIVWGAIWGVMGMVLSVPITVMIIAILAQFPSTKSVAILLSGTGQVDLETSSDSPQQNEEQPETEG